MKNKRFKPIIGIEVHIELKTESKMFCGCKAYHFRVKPNTHTCPICLGLPGALPVPNKKAIDWCLMVGLALGCQIQKKAKFDRKNYFYPDLAKGYQISQYDMPFARNGELKLKTPSTKAGKQSSKLKTIRINRVHLEEDTGKLIHRRLPARIATQSVAGGKSANTKKEEKYTLIDFNRSGVALMEVVSEPDIKSADEAVLYLKKLQQIIRYLDVSDCDMEKGSMRCEVNISLLRKAKSSLHKGGQAKLKAQSLPKYKVEVKNINSFKFVKKAIAYEIGRQAQILDNGKMPIQETRGFDEDSNKTFSQRTKEEAHDYRYFPEPDIPPIKLRDKDIKILRYSLPELPDKKITRFVKDYGLSEYNAKILTADRKTADYFDQAAKMAKITINRTRPRVSYSNFIKQLANVIVNKKANIIKISAWQLVNDLIKKKTAKAGDKKQLTLTIGKVLKENKKAVEDFKKGKNEVIGFLIGQVMRQTRGEADPLVVRKLVVKKLKNS